MRLTMRSGGTAYWKTGENAGYRPDDVCFKSEVERLDKLAAYEDTGLSPEEFRERTEGVLELYGKLKPYADAEEQGRLVILPCKVGETVWRIVTGRIDLTGYRMEWGEQRFIEGVSFRLSMLDAFGKTVFLTRAEAEAAFKGGQHDA